jgi:arabinose-5-phosphate isomerase
MEKESIKTIARKTVELEAASIQQLSGYIDDHFVAVVEQLQTMKGRLVVSGIGKSAIIGQKIVATLNSTGTPAIFMHAADAIHGDLGMIQEGDVVLVISKSGESPEIKVLAPLIKNMGSLLIGMVGNMGSYLAQQADHVLNTTVDQEACPNNLAPTTSTTAQMVMGDALAVCLMEVRGFTSSDFAKFHPGGALGKKLYLHVSDLYPQNAKPQVGPDTSLRDVIIDISSKRLGLAAVLHESGELLGVITDGDLRRMLQTGGDIHQMTASQIMTKTPRTVEASTLAVGALDLMRKNNITQLPVIDEGKYVGVIHLHDLIKEGLI